MKVVQSNAKGEVRIAIKSTDELTDEELAAGLNSKHLVSGFCSKEDVLSWNVSYHKDGSLNRVQPKGFTPEFWQRAEEERANEGIDLVDSCQLLFGKKHSKDYQSAKKRVGVTNEQVNAARNVLKSMEEK